MTRKNKNIDGIIVDSIFELRYANSITIDGEALEILPISSRGGHLLKIIDAEKKRGILLRVRRLVPNSHIPPSNVG